ncbi:CPBP family intramembrane metalloprotease [Halobellus sp. Atlit-38R]|uniref:CPBP family intramembrane glutamic endopeptidase n=1 Tax=Halobellus sp. Atlit-38R TaxID=2282131 RepID=UPI000EF17EB9|nr:type II CAAX endopeptidase family protein [Halobellus sp. Atlit-38R]RLM94460.1 CPBP family intramembrane metalloprotease [Halobellus sp. Atlit-38R]
MPQWATFAGFAFVVTAGLLLLSHASRGVLSERDHTQSDGDVDQQRRAARPRSTDADSETGANAAAHGSETEHGEPTEVGAFQRVDATDEAAKARHDEETIVLPKSGVEYRVTDAGLNQGGSAQELSTASLLANVAVSQGLFGVLLLAGAWYAEIPAWAFGVAAETVSVRALAIGVGLGLALYAANEAGAAVGAQFGLGEGERLRSALAPDTLVGWAVLLLVVLPIIAGFEELLFRGALVGVVAAGYDVSPWVLAVVSSGAFALGHGAQGRLGVLVTGTLGFVLAAVFVVTGSLLVVVVAHYLVNALEFVVHEGLGVEWTRDI